MATVSTSSETLDDLLRVEGKAELIGGRIVRYPLLGHLPGIAVGEIGVSLRDYAKGAGGGYAKVGCVVYAIDALPSGRQSFCPEVSYHRLQRPANRMKWLDGPPAFAVEMRRLGDHTAAAAATRVAKRADYFEAGTQVVWDVDPEAETVAKFVRDKPGQPTVFRRGEVADAEPAVPGWRMKVNDVFAPEG